MCEDRLVSLKCVVRTVKDIPWYSISNGTMKAGAHDETDGWYKAEEVLDALEDIPEAEKVKPFALDDPEKLQEVDGSMIVELMKSLTEQIPPANVIQHANICYELNSLYERKNRDYGDSFHKTYLEEGMAMARIRLTDKLERFKKLTREGGQEVNDESVRDTLIDMANYAIMTAMEMDREAEEE